MNNKSAGSNLAGLESRFLRDLSEWKLSHQQLSHTIQQRQQEEIQLAELEIVRDEIERLESDAELLKMVGPILQPIDRHTGLHQVQSRCQYLREEIDRKKKREENLNREQRDKRKEVRRKKSVILGGSERKGGRKWCNSWGQSNCASEEESAHFFPISRFFVN